MSVNGFLLYQKKNSWLERWDPRMKIIAIFLFGASLLLTHHIVLKTAQLAMLIIMWGIARLSWKVLAVTVLSLSIFFLSTMIYQAVLTPAPGDIMSEWGWLRFSPEGALRGVMMCEQIAGIVILLSLLVRTTSPIILAEGLEILLKPLKKWRLPVHEAVMMFSIALRFLPILIEEFDKIRKAQLARGGGFHRGGIASRFGGVLPMLMPLFVMSILRAKDLAVAMESRCYQGDEGRTPIRIYRFGFSDYAVFIFAVCNLLLVFMI
ncbi:energy-coupling factor transporter transmembrane protein EcfT [Paenibacillus sp. 7124]|uniref:Energy-coupling factor transporter transmembrane protein EcfT n=1 Tax=Paenibacillus apii TaxID=1850370 RepID=A0A6M1PEJ9_9BACL|nr:energy-coupling factor transporter transmembrane component T [Paenibacillus apii]NGM80882.1 energy-coupling factor transporter transmembrane protein EcfT [Paenibacillus apii]NJJ40773.1 energy-coupling factor transporter transmembrane protein EcfT [Paenibacillus apii]